MIHMEERIHFVVNEAECICDNYCQYLLSTLYKENIQKNAESRSSLEMWMVLNGFYLDKRIYVNCSFVLGEGRRTSCKDNGWWCNCDKRELF